jgi:hypothetical protein
MVPPGATKAFIVSYLPTEDGWHQTTLTMIDDADGRVVQISGWGASGWQNPVNPFDVNPDGHVTPQDVLLLINEINRGGDIEELPDDAGEGESGSDHIQSLDYGWWTMVNAVDSSASAVVPNSLPKTAPLDDWSVDWSTAASDKWAYRTTYRQRDVPLELETREADDSELPDWEALLEDPAIDLADLDAYFAEMS